MKTRTNYQNVFIPSGSGSRPVKQKEKEYWDNFYRQQEEKLLKPTNFAHFCLSFFPAAAVVCDLGCGNGRDSFHFAQQGHKVIAVDHSETAIESINYRKNGKIEPFCKNMTSLPLMQIDVAYSRFSLHSMEEMEEEAVLDWIQKAVKAGGLACIEVRSDKGNPEQMNYVFGKDHFRRHLNFQKLQEKLQKRGFSIEHAQEATGLAVYKNEDPLIIRIIARKRGDAEQI